MVHSCVHLRFPPFSLGYTSSSPQSTINNTAFWDSKYVVRGGIKVLRYQALEEHPSSLYRLQQQVVISHIVLLTTHRPVFTQYKHSVPESTQKKFLEAIAAFFALPLEEKEKLSQSNAPCHRGYERIGGQKLDELDETVTPDQKEGFSVRPDRPLASF
ncbi:hypothetical protein K469DRAFT_114493 [Zopfia rhizophila CBS 207.26]|uniref:Non-haem dioxygenase N-terminal domain-containing protein n=1 Tax=Zopfia rhizophila CBS 207.26 TaxID=1314779 RepID=A0A6A6EAA2_9PEZI|nr:hypothetical protein K469DRAFT_114493 [Zopfia rhizophila CBS 207.26]